MKIMHVQVRYSLPNMGKIVTLHVQHQLIRNSFSGSPDEQQSYDESAVNQRKSGNVVILIP